MGSYLTSAMQGVQTAAGNAGNYLQSTPIGQVATSAIQQGVGPTLAQLGQNVGQQTGLGTVAQGLQSLFGGGEAGHLADLGQPVPSGVELAGPSSTFTGGQGPGGFVQGMLEGFRGTAGNLGPDVGGAPQTGAGVGQFLAFLDRMNQRGAGGDLGGLVNAGALLQQTPDVMHRVTRMAPGYQVAQEPRGLITNLISGITYGILDKPVENQGTAPAVGFFPRVG